jgi:archaellum component FlaG (FlaF/FlaG flagellin family)
LENRNLIALLLIATLLVSTAFASLANAADDTVPSSIEPSGPIIASSPDADKAPISEPTDPDSAVSSGDEILYTANQGDNSTTTAVDNVQVPVEAEANLVSARANEGADNLWVILGLMGVSALGLGSVVGVVLYRRVPMNN